MKKARPISNSASNLVSWPMLALLALGSVLAAFFHQRELSVLALALMLAALAARLWAAASVREVYVTVEGSSGGVFAGEEMDFQVTVENRKLLPVVWMELFCPLSRSLCMVPRSARPADDWERMTLREAAASEELVGVVKLPFLSWYETVRLTSRWQTRRRGVYSTAGWRLCGGDGFGLTQTELPMPPESVRTFAVYPALVPVTAEPFLRSLWNADTGSRGVMEDLSVLRSTRHYQPGDNFKHINWRVSARGLPLTVNVYEDILPQRVHFLFDGESFQGQQAHSEEMEEALSILASVVVRLGQMGLHCGVSLPAGWDVPPCSVFMQDGTEAMLRALAAYMPLEEKRDRENGTVRIPQQSVFDTAPIMEALRHVGRFYYIAYSTEDLDGRELLRRLGPETTSIFTWQSPRRFGAFETLSLRQLKEVSHGA